MSSKEAQYESILPEFEAELALYKALELRQRVGAGPFLVRTLSYVALERQARRRQLARSQIKAAKTSLELKRGGSNGRRSTSTPPVESQLSKSRRKIGANRLVLRLKGFHTGIRNGEPIVLDRTNTHVCAYVSVLASSVASPSLRLLESYEVFLPILWGDEDATRIQTAPTHIEIALQVDFERRKRSESLHLAVHVYRVAEPLPSLLYQSCTVHQVVRSDGVVAEACTVCERIRKSFKDSPFYLFGNELSPFRAPHLTLPEGTKRGGALVSAQADTRALAFFELRVWSCEDERKREGELGLGAVGESLLPNSNLDVDLLWLRNVSYPNPPLSQCCDSPRTFRASLRPRSTVKAPIGVRSLDQTLPARLVWKASSGQVSEVLRTFRCPVCFFWCGSWDGLESHVKAHHFRLNWSRPEPGLFVCTPGSNTEEEHAVPKPVPKRMRFFHPGGAFEAGNELNSVETWTERDDPCGNWQDTQDERALLEFEDVARDERAVMLLWNKFIRENQPNESAPRTVDRGVLLGFIHSQSRIITKTKLFEQVIWVFITLHKFGLITPDDVLWASAEVRRAVDVS